MSENYYINSLYPFQDKVLNLIEKVDDTFYLTEGTALGRIYLRHRHSGDFKKVTDKIISHLNKNFPGIELALLTDDFARIFIHHIEHHLKIEFINDVLFRTGEIKSVDFFHKIDSWENILSNKICALARDDAKDVADLICLSTKYHFTWETMINYAR